MLYMYNSIFGCALQWDRTTTLIKYYVYLEICQGHWKWYEEDKLNKPYHNAKSDIYHIYSAQNKLKYSSSWLAQTLYWPKSC